MGFNKVGARAHRLTQVCVWKKQAGSVGRYIGVSATYGLRTAPVSVDDLAAKVKARPSLVVITEREREVEGEFVGYMNIPK